MIDPDDVLAPISESKPCGADLRRPNRDGALASIHTALRSARQALEIPGQIPEWEKVEKACVDVLCEKSKDTEIAAVLAEVLVNRYGIPGLQAGGAIVAGLLDRLWDELYPSADPGGEADPIEARLQPVTRLIGHGNRLMPAIRRIVLLKLSDGTEQRYEECRRAAQEQPPNLKLWPAIEKQFAGDPDGTLAGLAEAAGAAREAWTAVSAAMSARSGRQREECAPVIAFCTEVLRLVERLSPNSGPAPDEGQADADAAGAMPAAGVLAARQPASRPPVPIQDREAALRQLTELAAFFRQTEPYSPVSYTLEEVVRRAKLDWPNWLKEAVQDQTQRAAILLRLGLPPEAPSTA